MEAGGCLGFLPKAAEKGLAGGFVSRAHGIGPDQFDGGRTSQHAMGGAIDLTHAAPPEQVTQLVAPQLASLADLLAEAAYDGGGHQADGGADVVRQRCPKERRPRRQLDTAPTR